MDRLVLFRERSGPLTVFYVAILIQKILPQTETIRLLVIPDRCGSIAFRSKSIWIDKGSLSVGMDPLKFSYESIWVVGGWFNDRYGPIRVLFGAVWVDKCFARDPYRPINFFEESEAAQNMTHMPKWPKTY